MYGTKCSDKLDRYRYKYYWLLMGVLRQFITACASEFLCVHVSSLEDTSLPGGLRNFANTALHLAGRCYFSIVIPLLYFHSFSGNS